MIELTQTSLYPAGNCWQTAVACLLEIDPNLMPPQAEYDKITKKDDGTEERGPSYNNALQLYLRKHHGLAYCEMHIPEETLPFLMVAPPGYHLMTGRTVRSEQYGGQRHVVVGQYGKVLWDPHPSRAGLTDEIRWAFLVPFPKSWSQGSYWTDNSCPCPACKTQG